MEREEEEICRLQALIDSEAERAEKAHGNEQLAMMKIERLHNIVNFFACVIKCGEPWSDECQREYDRAME